MDSLQDNCPKIILFKVRCVLRVLVWAFRSNKSFQLTIKIAQWSKFLVIIKNMDILSYNKWNTKKKIITQVFRLINENEHYACAIRWYPFFLCYIWYCIVVLHIIFILKLCFCYVKYIIIVSIYYLSSIVLKNYVYYFKVFVD